MQNLFSSHRTALEDSEKVCSVWRFRKHAKPRVFGKERLLKRTIFLLIAIINQVRRVAVLPAWLIVIIAVALVLGGTPGSPS